MCNPVLCNRCAIAQPNAVVSPDVVERSHQSSDASRAADDPAMQADRHHARPTVRTHPIEPVEGISAVREEVFPGTEVAAPLQAAVIGVEAVRDHQMRATRNLRPIGQIVVVAVAVVQETAGFHHQSTRIGAWSPGVPAERSPPDHARDDLYVAQDVGAFYVLGNELVVDPALAMTGHLETALSDRGRSLRVALQGHA